MPYDAPFYFYVGTVIIAYYVVGGIVSRWMWGKDWLTGNGIMTIVLWPIVIVAGIIEDWKDR